MIVAQKTILLGTTLFNQYLVVDDENRWSVVVQYAPESGLELVSASYPVDKFRVVEGKVIPV